MLVASNSPVKCFSDSEISRSLTEVALQAQSLSVVANHPKSDLFTVIDSEDDFGCRNVSHPDDHTIRTTDTPGFKPFTKRFKLDALLLAVQQLRLHAMVLLQLQQKEVKMANEKVQQGFCTL